jgi:hypothetical protein
VIDRRVILQDLKNQYRIIGLLGGEVVPSQLPTSLSGIAEVQGGFCELVRVEPRYVLYREGISHPPNQDGA